LLGGARDRRPGPLIFLLDAALGILGRNLLLDILFLLGAGLVLWQGIETTRELR
jgi:hypothetical protein